MTRLSITSEEFTAIGNDVVRLMADYLDQLPTLPTVPATTAAEVEAIFGGDAPESPLEADALSLLPEVLRLSRPTGPRFFGYVLGSSDPVAAYGDFIAAILQQNVTAWRSSPAAITLERTVVRWLAEAIGLAGYAGSLCGGGSSANLMGLAMAREAKLPANDNGAQGGIVYVSTETHFSSAKAVALLGLGRRNIRTIPTDSAFRMDVAALERTLQADIASGFTPLAVVASAGSTATGAIDPINTIADIAEQYGLWLHIDGAYGGLAAMAAPEKFTGINRADSLSLDPHKWLYQPLSCGCLLYCDRETAARTFSGSAEYTKSFSSNAEESFAFFDESIELSRSFRALKLWLSIRYHGLNAIRSSIGCDMELAALLQQHVENTPELELLSPAALSAVCFRHRGTAGLSHDDLNNFNSTLLQQLLARGRVYLSNAELDGAFALRACIVNHRTEAADMQLIIDEVLATASSMSLP